MNDLKQPGDNNINTAAQEMTLRQWVERLPKGHKARKQLQTLVMTLETIRDAQVWTAMRDEHNYLGIDAAYVEHARNALKGITK